jgi:hypothetical protein
LPECTSTHSILFRRGVLKFCLTTAQEAVSFPLEDVLSQYIYSVLIIFPLFYCFLPLLILAIPHSGVDSATFSCCSRSKDYFSAC